MMTTEDRLSGMEARLISIEGSGLRVDCALKQIDRRFDDLNKLLRVAVGVYGASLIAGLIGIAIQLAT